MCKEGNTIGKLPELHIQKKYIANEDGNIIRVRSTSIILLIFMSDILMNFTVELEIFHEEFWMLKYMGTRGESVVVVIINYYLILH